MLRAFQLYSKGSSSLSKSKPDTMSLRRSGRQQNSSTGPAIPNEYVKKTVKPVTRKRVRKGATSEDLDDAVATPNGVSSADFVAMPPPPATPKSKKRRTEEPDSRPPPITPTPSAIGLMTSTSNLRRPHRNIDDAQPPPEARPAEPHHTNATLVTPGGTQVQSSYDDLDESPSKPSAESGKTTATLLKDACDHLVAVDPNLKRVIDQHHCRPFSPDGLAEEIDPFQSLVSGIISQQVSGAAAKSIKNKFIALYPPESCPLGFPPPALVAETTVPRLREAGLSQRKAEYVQGLAQKFACGEIGVQMLMNGSDEEVMEKLVAVRGLGVWSVEMFMCFALKRMDVFSIGDLGVQRGMAAYVGRDVAKLKAKGGKWKYMSEKDMLEIGERFRPYRSLFMWYMWRFGDADVEAVEKN